MILVKIQCSITDLYEVSPSNASELTGPAAPQAEAHAVIVERSESFTGRSIHNAIENELESQASCALQSPNGQEHGIEKPILGVKESQVGTSG